MRRYILLLSMILIPLLAVAQAAKLLRIDPVSAQGGALSDFFESINFIPLETTKASTFSSIDQLELTSKYYLILDKQSNCILIFERNGKFHAKIEGRKIGYPENRSINLFFLNPVDISINIPSPKKQNTMIRFDVNGKKISEINQISNGDAICFFPDKTTVTWKYWADTRLNDSTVYEISYLRNGRVVNKEFAYNQKKSLLPSKDILFESHSNFYTQGVGSKILFTRPYDYTLYTLSSSELDTLFRFAFPQGYSLPTDFLSDTTLIGKRISYLKNNNSLIYNLSHAYRFESKLFIKLKSFSSKFSYSLIYDLDSDNYYDISKMTPDGISSYLSISDADFGGASFRNFNFSCSDGTYLYTFTTARRLLDQMRKNQEKHVTYPDSLLDFMKAQDVNRNHIIIQLKPKNRS